MVAGPGGALFCSYCSHTCNAYRKLTTCCTVTFVWSPSELNPELLNFSICIYLLQDEFDILRPGSRMLSQVITVFYVFSACSVL